ncbi:DNA-dependent RNA polymerase I subunit A43 [Metarhizium album ARSEF 1941]|uniref:DNA-directed RNA polymerase subunit n=1 Tax=Metarhizium album (strain ARSEF 1941) TaxID=1081103 RepID=A0A0B2WLQ9_METAS|nr:DNA-dependent RNA polymerase I subunit A43 [Metarhizium album ARSEF 1941]KHN94868.1 DNA-dependent RNA polymerase I subunit A43 [Metarhizium album ARSEF 1941]
MSAAASPEAAKPKHDKKTHKERSSKSEKKRAREEDPAPGDGERKHKRSKSVAADAIVQTDHVPGPQDVKKEKKKREKKKKHGQKTAEATVEESEPVHEPKTEKKKKKKKHHKEGMEIPAQMDVKAEVSDDESKSKKKDRKKKKKHGHAADDVVDTVTSDKPKSNGQLTTLDDAGADAMDIDKPSGSTSKSSKVYQPPDIPANPQFPFFEQTVSLYEPLYPNGWAQPITSCQYQHLQHLQNKYVPSLRGVLLNYKNVTLGSKPGRDGAATDDETPTTVVSQNEYAVGFGWITADVELFVPSRGAWMEGSVNLQTEGHIGVVCFGKFNASVEARRLPPAWKWVSNESPEAHGFEETASVMTADDHGVVRQIHSTGFWVDGSGDRVKGKIRFRIRNFDAGTSGETSYLSLEGTMLDKDSEKKLVKEEARTAQMRRDKKGGRGAQRQRAPDFSMTRFADVEGENDGQQADAGG